MLCFDIQSLELWAVAKRLHQSATNSCLVVAVVVTTTTTTTTSTTINEPSLGVTDTAITHSEVGGGGEGGSLTGGRGSNDRYFSKQLVHSEKLSVEMSGNDNTGLHGL